MLYPACMLLSVSYPWPCPPPLRLPRSGDKTEKIERKLELLEREEEMIKEEEAVSASVPPQVLQRAACSNSVGSEIQMPKQGYT